MVLGQTFDKLPSFILIKLAIGNHEQSILLEVQQTYLWDENTHNLLAQIMAWTERHWDSTKYRQRDVVTFRSEKNIQCIE